MPTISLDAYGSWTALTLGAASLASDANLLAGRESSAVDNTTNKYLDVQVAGKVTVGTSPTAGKTIELWAYASFDATPTYPDVLDGTDSAETITSTNVKNSALRLVWSTTVDATSDRVYYIPPTSLAQLFGQVPSNWGLFLVHNTGVALNATAGNHVFNYRGIKYASA